MKSCKKNLFLTAWAVTEKTSRLHSSGKVIPAATTSLEEGASAKGLLPESAIEIENDFDKPHYGGPCPPKGDKPHRYVFTVYAINTDHLNLDAHSDRTSLETLLTNNSIGKASFTVRYGLKK